MPSQFDWCQLSSIASDELISKAIINEVLYIKSSQLPFYYHNINSNPLNRIVLHTRITSKSLIRSLFFSKKEKKKGPLVQFNLRWQIIIGARLFPHGTTPVIALLHTNHTLPPQQMWNSLCTFYLPYFDLSKKKKFFVYLDLLISCTYIIVQTELREI